MVSFIAPLGCGTVQSVSSMQPASTSYGRESTAVAGNDADEGGGIETGQEDTVAPEQMTKRISDQLHAVSMEVQKCLADTRTPVESGQSAGSNERMTKRKTRREKKTLMKKHFKAPDTSSDLMSELPFALTSPTTWKELGCTHIL